MFHARNDAQSYSKGRARCPQRAGTGFRRAGLLYAKVCAKREDFWDATGARTFLSAATPEYSTGSERSRALLPFDVAADKNVRAPLWFRLCRPGDRGPLPAVTDRIPQEDAHRADAVIASYPERLLHRFLEQGFFPGATPGRHARRYSSLTRSPRRVVPPRSTAA